MHQDNKLANHGKQVTSDSRSQIPGVNQQAQQQPGAAGHLGPKGVSAGSHGVKTNQISPGNPGLKAVSKSVSSVGGMLKTKSKRERSVSIDSGESRNAIPPALETDAKGGKTDTRRIKCISIRGIYCRQCVSVLSMLKFTSFTFLSAISLPETPDYVHSPPPQQEVNIRTERTEEVVYSLAKMPWPFSEASEFPPGFW